MLKIEPEVTNCQNGGLGAVWQQSGNELQRGLRKEAQRLKEKKSLGSLVDPWGHQGPLEGARPLKKRVPGGVPQKSDQWWNKGGGPKFAIFAVTSFLNDP